MTEPISLWRARAFLLLSGGALWACASPGPGALPAPPRLQRPSSAGLAHYRAAQSGWQATILMDLRTARRALADVEQHLRAAASVDRDCVLYLGKLGDVLLEQATLSGHVERTATQREQLALAVGVLESAVALAPEWIPGWLTLARVATRRGDTVRAQAHVARAQAELDALFASPEPAAPRSEILAVIEDLVRLFEAPGAPATDPDSRRLLLAMLHDSEEWREDPATPSGRAGPGRIGPTTAGLAGHLAARTELVRLEIDQHRPPGAPSPQECLARLDRALRLEPDLFAARAWRAEILRQLGAWRAAIDNLKPMVWSADPRHALIAGNPARVLTLTGLYLDLYLRPGAADRPERVLAEAQEWFAWLEHTGRIWTDAPELAQARAFAVLARADATPTELRAALDGLGQDPVDATQWELHGLRHALARRLTQDGGEEVP